IQSLLVDAQNQQVYLSGYTESPPSVRKALPASSNQGQGTTDIEYNEILYDISDFRWLARLSESEAYNAGLNGESNPEPNNPFATGEYQRGRSQFLLRNQPPRNESLRDDPALQFGAYITEVDPSLHRIASGGIAIPTGQNFLGGAAVGPNGAVY